MLRKKDLEDRIYNLRMLVRYWCKRQDKIEERVVKLERRMARLEGDKGAVSCEKEDLLEHIDDLAAKYKPFVNRISDDGMATAETYNDISALAARDVVCLCDRIEELLKEIE